MTDRSDSAIRADLAAIAGEDLQPENLLHRLAADVAPLLARAVAAEARADWSCPDCAFTFDAMHTDADDGYSCPHCAELRLEAELAEARARVAAVALVRERMRNANFWQIGRAAWEAVEAELDAASDVANRIPRAGYRGRREAMSSEDEDDRTPDGDPIRTYKMWLQFPEGETAITADATAAVAAFKRLSDEFRGGGTTE